MQRHPMPYRPEWFNSILVAIYSQRLNKFRVIELPIQQTVPIRSKQLFNSSEQAEEYCNTQYGYLTIERVEYEDIFEEIARRKAYLERIYEA